MKFATAIVKSIKADLDAKDISITFKVPWNDLDEALELAQYMGKDASDMNLDVTPRQLRMFKGKEAKP